MTAGNRQRARFLIDRACAPYFGVLGRVRALPPELREMESGTASTPGSWSGCVAESVMPSSRPGLLRRRGRPD